MSFSRTSWPGSSGQSPFTVLKERSTLHTHLLCAIVLSFFLASCGGPNSSAGPPQQPASSGTTVSAQQSNIAPVRGVPAPPDAAARPLQSGESGTEYMPNGLPALKPAQGLKADLLFAEKLSSPDARFDRLENAVTGIRQEFDAVKPAIVRLAAVEEDMQILLKQLETLVQNPPPAPEPSLMSEGIPVEIPEALPAETAEAAAAPMPVVPAESAPQTVVAPAAVPTQSAQAQPPQQTSSGPHVQNIRVGEHGDVTRLVIDLNAATTYRHDLDNNENLLLVELPDAGWSAGQQGSAPASSLIESWSVQAIEGGKGSRMIIRLRRDAVIVKDSALSAPDRIMIDLKAL